MITRTQTGILCGIVGLSMGTFTGYFVNSTSPNYIPSFTEVEHGFADPKKLTIDVSNEFGDKKPETYFFYDGLRYAAKEKILGYENGKAIEGFYVEPVELKYTNTELVPKKFDEPSEATEW